MSAGTDYAIAELQHAVRELAARVDSIEQARNSTAAAGKCTLTVRELTALPVGSVVEEADSGRRWRRDDDGLWYRPRDGVAANEGGLYSYELCKVGAPLVEVWTKQADPPGMWKAGSNVVTDGILEKVFGQFSAAVDPARRIDTEDALRKLSVGARVRATNGVVWEKQDDGWWTSGVPHPRKASGMLWVSHGPVFTLVRE